MNQTNLDRAIARVTGEPVRRIRNMGFTLISVPIRPFQGAQKGSETRSLSSRKTNR